MVVSKLTAAMLFALAAPSAEPAGTISGVVVNASAGKTPAGQSPVVLRVQLNGDFVPFQETTSDARGRFLFRGLPVGREYVYLPGANREGVHHPGPRVALTSERPHAEVELSVFDSVAEPSPLVIRRQEITLRPQQGALSVTESLTIENPSSKCYVGRAPRADAEPITLELAIPSNFDRTTFHKEFFGRRFALEGGKLVTGIPWRPGTQELAFTYLVPNARSRCTWRRPLDLPCSHVLVRVRTNKTDEVSCNLEPGPAGGKGEVVFQAAGQTLPAGYTICVELGRLPIAFMSYARWLALAALLVLAAGTSLVAVRRRRRVAGRIAGAEAPSGPLAAEPLSGQSPGSARSRRNRRGSSHRAA